MDRPLPGRFVALSHQLHAGIPHYHTVPPFTRADLRRLGDVTFSCGTSFASDLIVMPTHIGTHIDALSHVAVDGQSRGAGADEIPPIVRRGVLLDCRDARYDADGAIHPDDIRLGLERLANPPRAGDIILVATGWESHWNIPAEYIGQGITHRGLDAVSAKLLAEFEPFAVGADNPMLETANSLPAVHRTFLFERGVHIIENLRLNELCMTGAHEFTFVALPLPIVGATSSPIAPIALLDERG